MQYYKKLIITFSLILFVSCTLGSLLKQPIDMLVEKSDSFANMVDYREGVYNYSKVMRRIFIIVAIAVLVLFRKSLDIVNLSVSGWQFKKGWGKDVRTGILIGICSVFIYSLYTLFIGVQVPEDKTRSLGSLISKPVIYLLAACLTAAFEETLFRGVVFKGLKKDLSLAYSVIFSSLFYAFLHFFSFRVLVHPGSQPFVGFSTLLQFLIHGFSEFGPVLQFVIGLFFVGVILSVAYDKTKSLFLPIGLHAGWVCGIKLNNYCLDHNKEVHIWFFGDGNMVSSFCGWIFLLGVFLFIKKVLFRPGRQIVEVID